jgi:NADH dehydrogenase FAD-containing subunit
MARQTIVFVGGGHAHLYALRRASTLVKRGLDVVLVNPSPHLEYSGMATGVISGYYTPDQYRIDVQSLVVKGGGRFVKDSVVRILADDNRLVLGDGSSLRYDAVSFCIGGEVEVGADISDGELVIPVKPVSNARRIRDLLKRPDLRVVVAGGGAAGCEVAANAVQRLDTSNPKTSLTLVESGPELLEAGPRKARRAISSYLQDNGVETILNSRVESFEEGTVRLDSGRGLSADALILATGSVPPPLFSRSGVLTGEDGGLWTDAYLRSPTHPNLFGGGDAISFRGARLPGLGVHAIRQGPILFHNIQAYLLNEASKAFVPQQRYLYVLNLGDGTGLGIRGDISWKGRSAMTLKDSIDQRFINEYSR